MKNEIPDPDQDPLSAAKGVLVALLASVIFYAAIAVALLA